MISLNDTTWSTLTHAYGCASDIPGLLERLDPSAGPLAPDSQPFFDLWSALCHQGDTCTAAYAAVPHIIDSASRKPSRYDYNFLLLPVSIEIARSQDRGPAIPDSLTKSYTFAIDSMPKIVGQRDRDFMDETWSLAAAAAVCVAAGFCAKAEAVLELEGESAQEFLDWKSGL